MDKKRAWLGQPQLLKNLVKKFGNHIKNIGSHITPGMPKVLIISPMIESKKITTKDQWDYWLGMGFLLYLIKHSQPDIVNETIELSKANNGANPAAYKEL